MSSNFNFLFNVQITFACLSLQNDLRYIVSGGALNSTHSLTHFRMPSAASARNWQRCTSA